MSKYFLRKFIENRNSCIYNLCMYKNMGSVISSITSKPDVIIDMSTPKATEVLESIQNDKVVIFSKSYCPYCVMAKQQFQKLSQPFLAIELDKREDGDEIQNILGQITGGRTVPRVFIKGKFIGGGTDVKAMHDDGSLQKMLEY